MRIFTVFTTAALLVACGGDSEREPEAGDTTARETARQWTPCELVWAKITNADLAGDREREAELKQLAREFQCSGRPATVPWGQEYPEADNMPDPPVPQPSPLYRSQYNLSYGLCSDRDELYDQAGTTDPQEAVEWYLEGVQEGSYREGSADGCLDALTGRPHRFEDRDQGGDLR